MTDTAPGTLDGSAGGFPEIKPAESAPPGLGRLIAALRRLQDLTVATNPADPLWTVAAQHVEDACAVLDGHQVPEGVSPAGRVIELPGLGHPLLPPWTVADSGAHGVTMQGHFTRSHVGGNNAVHGGMIPLYYDWLFGMVVSGANCPPTRTAFLHVDYRNVTPIDAPLTAHGRITDVDGRKIFIKPIVRHNVSNVLFTELRPGEARVRSYFTVVTHIGLDHCGRYRDLLVPDGGGVADQTPRGVHRLGGARLGHGPVAPAGRRFRSMPGRMFAERPATATDITAHQRIAATPMAPSARRLRNDRRSCDHRSRPRNTKTGRHATTQRARRVLLVPGITDAAAEHLLCDGAGPRHDAGRLHLRAV